MGRTQAGNEPSRTAASRWSVPGTVAAYAASLVAFAYALVSLYWALGGHGLISTVGGYPEQLARGGGAAAVLLAWAATAVKVAGGLLALGLVRPWGRLIPRRWLLLASAGASVLLVAYGGLNVAAGALVLTDVIHPSRSTDLTALRWHAGLWDLWFLVWGILLTLATFGYWKRTINHRTGHTKGVRWRWLVSRKTAERLSTWQFALLQACAAFVGVTIGAAIVRSGIRQWLLFAVPFTIFYTGFSLLVRHMRMRRRQE